MIRLLFAIALLLLPFCVSAKTFIGQDIEQNQYWTKNKSPYIITKDIVLHANAILNIQAGTEILFSANVRLIIEGSIWAVGSPKSPIIWTGLNENKWNGLLFRRTKETALLDTTISHFKYCNFIGKNYEPVNLILIENRNIDMKFCKLQGAQTALQTETLATLNFDNGEILDSYRPLHIRTTSFMKITNSDISKFGVMLISGSMEFMNNKVERSLARGRYTGMVIWLFGGGVVDIVNNKFSKAADTAFTLYKSSKKSTINLSNNTFQKNEINLSIACEYASKGNFIVKDNSFYKPKHTNILIFDLCQDLKDTLIVEANYFHKLKESDLLSTQNISYDEKALGDNLGLVLDFKGLLKEKPKFAKLKKN